PAETLDCMTAAFDTRLLLLNPSHDTPLVHRMGCFQRRCCTRGPCPAYRASTLGGITRDRPCPIPQWRTTSFEGPLAPRTGFMPSRLVGAPSGRRATPPLLQPQAHGQTHV